MFTLSNTYFYLVGIQSVAKTFHTADIILGKRVAINVASPPSLLPIF